MSRGGKVDGIFGRVRLFPVLALASFACLALSFPLADTDIWWHLAAGREIWRTGKILHADSFCSSSMGTPWIDLHWGFQILVWRLWSWFGNGGLVILRVVLPLLAIGSALCRRLAWSTALAGCLALWILRDFVDARPLLLSLLLLVAVQCALERAHRWGMFRVVLACLACQVALSNVQGLFLLGPMLVAGFAYGDWREGRHRAALEGLGLCAGMLIASLANPYGIHAFGLAGKIAGRIVPGATNIFSSQIPENAPLWVWAAEDPRRLVPLAWLGSGVAILWRRDAWSRGRLFLLAGSAILSFMAVRNLPLLCLEAAFCMDPFRHGPILRLWTISAAAVVLALALQAGLEKRWDLCGSSVAPFRLPGKTALALIRDSARPVFHEIRAGGWLAWNLDAPGSCWADTRLVLHDERFLSEYLDAVDRPEHFPLYARRWNFGFALIPLVEFPRFHPLAAFLLRSREWSLVDCDGAWALFERRQDVDTSPRAFATIPTDSISAELSRRFHGNHLLESAAREATLAFFLGGGRSDLARSWAARP
jgi:hypothetical protein